MKPDTFDPIEAATSRSRLLKMREGGKPLREALIKEAKRRQVDPGWLMAELAHHWYYGHA